MNILYFAWLRQNIGTGSEELKLPEDVDTVGHLVDWLKGQGSGYSMAFRDVGAIRVAINQEFGDFETSITDEDEIAFFPPVTGG